MKFLSGITFFGIFLVLDSSSLADSIKIQLPFRYMIIPLYQWLSISTFIIFWKYLTHEPWRKVLTKGITLGLILCLYLPMLDAQRQVWSGVPLSRIYILYINSFVFAITSLLLLWGAATIKSVFSKTGSDKTNFFGDIVFFPVFLSSIYGIFFYYSSGHRNEAIFLLGVFIFFLYILHQDKVITKAVYFARLILKKIANRRALLIAIFVFALIIRLVFLFNLLTIEGSRYPVASDDGDTYDTYGWKGVSDPMIFIRESPHYFMVFYSVLLSIIYAVFGHNYAAVGIIQSIIGALLCVAIFILAYRVTGKKAIAFLSSLGIAINSALIHLTTTFNTEALYIPFVVLFILFLLFYRESNQDGKALLLISLAGFILGLAALVRELAVGLFVLAVFWVLIWGRNYSKRRITKRVRDVVILFLLLLAPILPITYVNYKNTGEFYLIYDTKGRPSWGVSSPFGEELVPSNKKLIELGIIDPIADPSRSIKAFLKSPKETVKILAQIVPKRMKNLFFWPNFGYFDPVFLINLSKYANRYASNLEFYTTLLFFTSLLVFAFSNIKIASKSLIFLTIVYYAIFYGIFFLSHSPRYRSPIDPFLAIIISFGIYKIFKMLAPKEIFKNG